MGDFGKAALRVRCVENRMARCVRSTILTWLGFQGVPLRGGSDVDVGVWYRDGVQVNLGGQATLGHSRRQLCSRRDVRCWARNKVHTLLPPLAMLKSAHCGTCQIITPSI